jgi:hypothetical protein
MIAGVSGQVPHGYGEEHLGLFGNRHLGHGHAFDPERMLRYKLVRRMLAFVGTIFC